MEYSLKIEKWISVRLKSITIVLIVFAILIIKKQQKDIERLTSEISDVYNNVSAVGYQVNNVLGHLDDVKSDLYKMKKQISDIESYTSATYSRMR